MIEVAKLGKAVGLKGYLKLHSLSDFPEQFKVGSVYHSRIGELTIEAINNKGEVKFVGYDSREAVTLLTNLILSSTVEESNEACELGEDEYFWYDIIGLDVYEGGSLLGTVQEIERYPTDDHLLIETSETIQKTGVKRFLLPFNARTIVNVDIKAKRLNVTGALEIIDVIAS